MFIMGYIDISYPYHIWSFQSHGGTPFHFSLINHPAISRGTPMTMESSMPHVIKSMAGKSSSHMEVGEPRKSLVTEWGIVEKTALEHR